MNEMVANQNLLVAEKKTGHGYAIPSEALTRSRLNQRTWVRSLGREEGGIEGAVNKMFKTIDKKGRGGISYNQMERYFSSIGMPSVIQPTQGDEWTQTTSLGLFRTR
jgi:hypothetical protein